MLSYSGPRGKSPALKAAIEDLKAGRPKITKGLNRETATDQEIRRLLVAQTDPQMNHSLSSAIDGNTT
jgi:hypothetical protein